MIATERASLLVFVEGKEIRRVSVPEDFGARAWILGVVGLKVFVGQSTSAALNLGVTGAQDEQLEIAPNALVQVAVVRGNTVPALPHGPGARPGITVALDDEILANVNVNANVNENVRGFGHVFCRWLRDEPDELGFDLTGFQVPDAGVKYQRVVSRPVSVGQVVSYRVAL